LSLIAFAQEKMSLENIVKLTKHGFSTIPKILVLSALATLGNGAKAQIDDFEYGSWELSDAGARTSTVVADAENVLSIVCLPENGRGDLHTQHSLLLASDDRGNVPPDGWAKTVKSAEVKFFKQGKLFETFVVETVRDDIVGVYDSEFWIKLPNTKAGAELDSTNANFIDAVIKSSIISVTLKGRNSSYSATFTGKGSANAISQTYCAR